MYKNVPLPSTGTATMITCVGMLEVIYLTSCIWLYLYKQKALQIWIIVLNVNAAVFLDLHYKALNTHVAYSLCSMGYTFN